MELARTISSVDRFVGFGHIAAEKKRFKLTIVPQELLFFCKIQSAVRIILGKPYESYTETLKELDMKRLSERRDLICLKFAKNSLRLENFKTLFPMHKNNHEMKTRQHERYHVKRSYGKRYAVSAIPSMQKLLNKEHKKQREAFKSLLSPTNYALQVLLLR